MKALQNLSQRERYILLATLAIVLLVGGYLGVFENLRDRWRALNDEIASLDMMLKASIQSYQEESRIKEEYNQVVASLRIEGTESDKQIRIMQELNALMMEAGVTPSNAKPMNIIEEQNFQIFNFSYDDTETDMINLTRFLDLLEKRSMVSEIQMIEIKAPSPPLYEPGEQRFKTNYRISRLVYRR